MKKKYETPMVQVIEIMSGSLLAGSEPYTFSDNEEIETSTIETLDWNEE